MTDIVGPFDDQAWAQAEWFDHMPTALPSGVIGSPASASSSGGLPFSSSGLAVSIGDGKANVGGAGFKRTGGGPPVTVTANTNASLSRRDRVVLRRDIAANTGGPVVIPGTASASPTAPAIQRTTTLFDLPLYSFLVPPSSGTTLTSVTDERPWVGPNGYRGVSVYAAAARLALSAGGDLNPGARAYESSTSTEYLWDGTNWSAAVARTYFAQGSGGGSIGTSHTAPASGASVTLPAGTWNIDYRLHFSLSVSSARGFSIDLWDGSTVRDSASFNTVDTGVTISRTVSTFTQLVLSGATTLSVQAEATATGGTQTMGPCQIRAVRAA